MDQNQSEQPPLCPGCGSTTAAVLTQTLEYDVQDEHRLGQPISIMIVYKCRCGRAFTDRVKFYPLTVAGESPGD